MLPVLTIISAETMSIGTCIASLAHRFRSTPEILFEKCAKSGRVGGSCAGGYRQFGMRLLCSLCLSGECRSFANGSGFFVHAVWVGLLRCRSSFRPV